MTVVGVAVLMIELIVLMTGPGHHIGHHHDEWEEEGLLKATDGEEGEGAGLVVLDGTSRFNHGKEPLYLIIAGHFCENQLP